MFNLPTARQTTNYNKQKGHNKIHFMNFQSLSFSPTLQHTDLDWYLEDGLCPVGMVVLRLPKVQVKVLDGHPQEVPGRLEIPIKLSHKKTHFNPLGKPLIEH